MSEQLLPSTQVQIDGQPTECITRTGFISAYQLALVSTLPALGVQLDSLYLGHPDANASAAVHLALRPGERAQLEMVEHDPAELPVRDARRRCLFDHLHYLQDLLAQHTGHPVAVDVDQQALDQVDLD